MTAETTAETVRAHYGEPSDRALAKQLVRLDGHARAFIALSPFLVIASSDAAGRGDATPRGDAPGFVAVLDDATLLIPDRLGNRRADTMLNVTENPQVGLLFLVPGIDESLRVNGRARFTTDADLLAPLAVQGRPPVAGLIVTVEEVYFHCGKALMRSRLWDPDTRVERASFPSLGRILADQIAGSDVRESERFIEESYRTRLY
ncbi:MAG: pyridoxamine 5'-phosphate oxidase family protein [Methylobacterium sp.]|uniref:pyridoxamine 5'-phosphate oxidase family protein n=1 Tax=Methylobacterium sp. TaxID=409 RepID=UPI00258D4D56|nr:pyridoxamine 5'-phosphate oxidase family protein [Methylobacterium sp.]MBY0294529.1 pyridoxamine 5'-phosphate oxidase family protein [Methylobacterium sp.]